VTTYPPNDPPTGGAPSLVEPLVISGADPTHRTPLSDPVAELLIACCEDVQGLRERTERLLLRVEALESLLARTIARVESVELAVQVRGAGQ
jgi:hypothetical protein